MSDTPLSLPTAKEIKIMAQELLEATTEYILAPTVENLQSAKMARMVLHASVTLVTKALSEVNPAYLHDDVPL